MSAFPTVVAARGTSFPFRILYSGCQEAKRLVVDKLIESTAVFSRCGYLIDDFTGMTVSHPRGLYLHCYYNAGQLSRGRPSDALCLRAFDLPDLVVCFHGHLENSPVVPDAAAKAASWWNSSMLQSFGIPVLDVVGDVRDIPLPWPVFRSLEEIEQYDFKYGTVDGDISKFLRMDDDELCEKVDEIFTQVAHHFPNYPTTRYPNYPTTKYLHPLLEIEWDGYKPALPTNEPDFNEPDFNEPQDTEMNTDASDETTCDTTSDNLPTTSDNLPAYEAIYSRSHVDEPTTYDNDLEKGFATEEAYHYAAQPVLLRIVGVKPELAIAKRGRNRQIMIGPWTLGFFIFYALFMFFYSCYNVAIHLPGLLEG